MTLTAAPPRAPSRFGLDGTDYAIDLNAKHATQLRDALARYVHAVRMLGWSVDSRVLG
jgi:Lsr2